MRTAPRAARIEARHRWVIFALVAIAQFMVVLDTAIINVALPVIKTQLHFSGSSIQWVVTAYVLTFGGFLLFGGRAADLFGRRRVLLCGMGAFTFFSLLIGLDSSGPQLIVLRGLQGLSAAFMSPSALSIVLVTFDDELERRRAIGYWSVVATGGAAVGLLLGGALTQYAGWHWNFFINVPIGLIVGALILRELPAHETAQADRGLDAQGAVLVTVGLMGAVLGVSEGPNWGWLDGRTLVVLVTSLVLLSIFVINEHRVPRPLAPPRIFRSRNLSAANVMMGCVYAGNLGLFFLLTLYMQDVLGYSAIHTGLAFLPFPVILGFTATRMAKLITRFGFRRFLMLGPATVAVGMAWICFLPVPGHYVPDLLPALLIMPIGYGLSFPSMYAAATTGVEPRLSGLASGLIATSQQMGGALGLAILSGVAASATASALGHEPISHALTRGYNTAMVIGVGFTVVSVFIAAFVVRSPRRVTSPVASVGESQ